MTLSNIQNWPILTGQNIHSTVRESTSVMFCPVSSCPYGKDGLFVDTQFEGLVPREWARNHGGILRRVGIAKDWRLLWFCLLWRLMKAFSLSASLLRRLLYRFRHCVDILPTSDFLGLSERQIILTRETRLSATETRLSATSPIGYRTTGFTSFHAPPCDMYRWSMHCACVV